MLRISSLLLLAFTLAACQSRPLGPYLSPRVTGEVLAADTEKPLAKVTVDRGGRQINRPPGPPPKGGELLMRKPLAQTDQHGRFILSSERVLSIIRPASWNMVVLEFERAGYQRFRTNFPVGLATNSQTGEPILDTGKVFLQPAPTP
jgi:hypothetical protein